MPSYSFNERFVPFVKDFTKRQTIRGIRKYPAKPGDLISHFAGSRFKPLRIIPKQTCTAVDTILILEEGTVVIVTDIIWNKMEAEYYLTQRKELFKFGKLSKVEKDELAFKDGFREFEWMTPGRFEEMIGWWKQTHQLPFAGHIIKW